MHTNDANEERLIYKDLSYLLTGICFTTHNALGRYAKEKQYGDIIEQELQKYKINYKREYIVSDTRNIIDFLIEDKIVMELKAKQILLKLDYFQTQRYLQALDMKLGLLVNFRSKYLKPVRVIKLEKGLGGKL